MAKEPRTDVLAQTVGIEAKLTPTTASIKAKSRLVAAIDRLGGSWFDERAATIEGRTAINRATDAAKMELLGKATKAIGKKIEQDPELALTILSGGFDEAIRGHQNRSRIAHIASEELPHLIADAPQQDTKADRPKEIDPDWMAQFYDHAGKATSDDLQKVFGRILASESIAPGSFSKRTLRSVMELDHHHAALFQDLARNRSADNAFLIQPHELQGPELFQYKELEEAGLIGDPGGFMGYQLKFDEEGKLYFRNQNKILYLKRQNQQEYKIGIITITKFGKDICSLFPVEDQSIYLEAAYRQIRAAKFPLAEAQIGNVTVEHADGRLQWVTTKVLPV